jgi:hypothetical protein
MVWLIKMHAHPEYVSKEQAKEIDDIAHAAQQWFIENWQDEIH